MTDSGPDIGATPGVVKDTKRDNGYDITATPLGVVVARLADCKVQIDRGEPNIVLIPWPQVSGACAVSDKQPK